MEEKINAIVSKIRKMFRYSPELKELLSKEPYARVRMTEGGYEIEAIYIEDAKTGNILFIQPTETSLYDRAKNNKRKPEKNPYTTIVKYNSYDELLAME